MCTIDRGFYFPHRLLHICVAACICVGCRDKPDGHQTHLPPPNYAMPLGAGGPIQVIAHADNGRWAVACQGAGPSLIRGGGMGIPVDAYVASSRDGRWVAVIQNHELVVIDDLHGIGQVIRGADARGHVTGFQRVAAFTATSDKLIYFRSSRDANVAVIRDLQQGTERQVDLGDGVSWSTFPEEAGNWVRLLLAPAESAHSGTFAGPELSGSHDSRESCIGRKGSYSIIIDEATIPQDLWLDASTRELLSDPTLLGHIAGRAVRKRKNKELHLDEMRIATSDCDADILALSDEPLRVLATCAAPKREAPIELFGRDLRVTSSRLVPRPRIGLISRVNGGLYCRTGARSCISLADGKELPLPGFFDMMASGNLLIEDDQKRYSIVNSATGRVVQIPELAGEMTARAGGVVALGTVIADVGNMKIMGTVPRQPIAVDINGRALVAAMDEHRTGSAHGPLEWMLPRPLGAEVAHAPRSPDWVVTGRVVDDDGRPVAGAAIMVSDVRTSYDSKGREVEYGTWSYSSEFEQRPDAITSFLRVLPETSDANGQFRWMPNPDVRDHAVMVRATDGRVGAADLVRMPDDTLKIRVARGGSLRIECRGFATDNGVDLVSGARTLYPRCGETVHDLPKSRYLVFAKIDNARYAETDLEVRDGVSMKAILEIRSPAKIIGRAIEYPGNTPLAGVYCDARSPMGIYPGRMMTSGRDGQFFITISEGHLLVWCEDPREELADGAADVELHQRAEVVVRMVRHRSGAVNVGVEFTMTTQGARILSSRKRAEHAGLAAGDVVSAVNGIPLAGLSWSSAQALAFEFPLDVGVVWTVLRNSHAMNVTALASQ